MDIQVIRITEESRQGMNSGEVGGSVKSLKKSAVYGAKLIIMLFIC